MLETTSEAEMFYAPFGRASASWIGGPGKESPLIGLTVTVDGETDAVAGVPIKYMVRIRPEHARRLLSSLLDALYQTQCARRW